MFKSLQQASTVCLLCVPLYLYADPLDYSVRLSVTDNENRGYLEVSLSGDWLQVLADESWDLSQADLVCCALGFHYSTSAEPVLVFEGQDAYPDERNFTTLRCWVVEGNNRICNSSAPLGSDNSTSEDMIPLEIQCNGQFIQLDTCSIIYCMSPEALHILCACAYTPTYVKHLHNMQI